MTIYDVLDIFRKSSVTERYKGEKFEKLMLRWLKADPVYANLFSEVWMWDDFPFKASLGGKDLGIDLVAKDDKGGYWAVQCKFYDNNTVIQKAAVDSFLANSGRSFVDDSGVSFTFTGRMWISTNEKFGKNAEETLRNQIPEVTMVNLDTLDNSQVDWQKLVSGKNGNEALRQKATPRDYQIKIIDSAIRHFKKNDRGTLVMACGTGKTLTSMFITQKMLSGKGLVLFLAPSIALVGQSLNSWFANSEKPLKAVCICSDNKAGEIDNEDSDRLREDLSDLPIKSCTNEKTVAKEIEFYKNYDGLVVCFSTYQSIDVVHKAQQQLLKKYNGKFGYFDLVICDEAHRTASVIYSDKKEGDFTKIHNNDFIKAEKRMYMTATPKIYNDSSKNEAVLNNDVLCSMDNEDYFGKHFYTLGFGTAVQNGLLTDYKVIVLTIDSKYASSEFLNKYKTFVEEEKKKPENQDKEIDHFTTDQQAMVLGSVSALSKQLLFVHKDDFAEDEDLSRPMHTAIAFCDNVYHTKVSKGKYVIEETAFAFKNVKNVYKEALKNDPNSKDFIDNLVEVTSETVSGDMPTTVRNEKLKILRKEFKPDSKECSVVCNVNCLSEGVDVPALDAAIFLATKKSMITIVQSVGRVMRKFEGKKYGYIIVPVIVDANAEPDKELDKNTRYKLVWTILQAMRAHDERLAAELSNHNYKHVIVVGPGGRRGGSGRRGGYGGSGGTGGNGGSGTGNDLPELPLVFFDKLYARMVDKVGERFYWEKWSKKTGEIAQRFIIRLNELLESGKYTQEMDEFVKMLQFNINPSIDREQTVTFLAQQLITQPVFDALFPDYDFTKNNSVSRSMQKMLEKVGDEAFVDDRQELDNFYDNVRQVCGTLKTVEEKQDTIKTLYEKFFKGAFPKTVEQLGIVYTPVECVDFIIKSVDGILKKEFGLSLADNDVNILDPFTGTGTFITQTLNYLHKKGVTNEQLTYKYLNEIHCNEIVLLSYYIADVNIETVFNGIVKPKEYLPYDNICLTDTFQLAEPRHGKLKFKEFFKENTEQVKNQQKLPVRVIFGNPPYSVGQKSANDNAQNLDYPALNERIAETYAKESSANLQKGLYDSYIKAFRWATDRIKKKENQNGGIVAFISNGSWLDGNATDGFRKCIENEFTDIYVFNLRGNARTSGELRRKERDSVFGQGTRTTITITILVNNPDKYLKRGLIETQILLAKMDGKKYIPTEEEQKILDYKHIHYLDIGDYLSRDEKLRKIKEIGSVLSKKFGDNTITPNKKGDWINQRGNEFDEMIPMFPEKNFNEGKSFFRTQAIGVATNRDSWDYNFSKSELEKNIRKTIGFYNNELGKIEPTLDATKISWTVNLHKYFDKKEQALFNSDFISIGLYRPFQKQHLYYDRFWIERPGQWTKIFPTPNHKNLVICVSCLGTTKGLSVVLTDVLPDLHSIGDTQCFPLYWYESQEEYEKRRKKSEKQLSLNLDIQRNYNKDSYGYFRHEGVTDYILQETKKRFSLSSKSTAITKEDIFYYIYGILHSPEYRTKFSADLKKSLPRIPIVESAKDFRAFADAGRKLADLHINYETVEPCHDVKVEIKKEDFKVTKMRFPSKDNKTEIIYNDYIRLTNIPPKAYEYIVNGKSAIEWIMERYQKSQDKNSLIINDCNLWATEHEKPRYILDLLLSIITVSVKTVEIVKGLPGIK